LGIKLARQEDRFALLGVAEAELAAKHLPPLGILDEGHPSLFALPSVVLRRGAARPSRQLALDLLDIGVPILAHGSDSEKETDK
jgi:hypothetical protein